MSHNIKSKAQEILNQVRNSYTLQIKKVLIKDSSSWSPGFIVIGSKFLKEIFFIDVSDVEYKLRTENDFLDFIEDYSKAENVHLQVEDVNEVEKLKALIHYLLGVFSDY